MVPCRFVKPEIMDGSNTVFCEVCDKKTVSSRGVFVKELPKFLTLQVCVVRDCGLLGVQCRLSNGFSG